MQSPETTVAYNKRGKLLPEVKMSPLITGYYQARLHRARLHT